MYICILCIYVNTKMYGIHQHTNGISERYRCHTIGSKPFYSLIKLSTGAVLLMDLGGKVH